MYCAGARRERSSSYLEFVDEDGDGIELVARASCVCHGTRGNSVNRSAGLCLCSSPGTIRRCKRQSREGEAVEVVAADAWSRAEGRELAACLVMQRCLGLGLPPYNR